MAKPNASFVIVEFLNSTEEGSEQSKAMEVGSSSWLNQSRTEIMWPNKEKELSVTKYASKHKQPGRKWKPLPVRVLMETGKFLILVMCFNI